MDDLLDKVHALELKVQALTEEVNKKTYRDEVPTVWQVPTLSQILAWSKHWSAKQALRTCEK